MIGFLRRVIRGIGRIEVLVPHLKKLISKIKIKTSLWVTDYKTMSLQKKVDAVRKEMKLREDESGKFRKMTLKERFWNWINTSRFVLAVTMLTIGSSWTFNYIEGMKFYSEVVPMRNYAIESLETYEEGKNNEEQHLLGQAAKAAGNQMESQIAEVEAEAPQDNSKIGVFSAYNAEVAQTDGDPFTMASGKKVYEGAIANNCLPFGTKVLVHGKVKVVEDRMNSRYDCSHFDIFMNSYDQAIKFGRQEIEYQIIN